MGRALRFTLIGCGGLVGLFLLLGIVGALIGGGEETATGSSEQAQQEPAPDNNAAEKAKAERETEQAKEEAAEARREAEAAKEDAARAKKEADEAEQAKAEAEDAQAAAAPEEEPSPAPEENSGGNKAVVRVTGTAGEAFTGSYGNLDTTQSVDGTVPAEYEVEVDTGFLSVDSVTAVMQKAGPGANPLNVEILFDGEVVKETSTTAEYGVATVTWSPSE